MIELSNYTLNALSYTILFSLFLVTAVLYGALKRADRTELRFFCVYVILVWIHAAAYLFQVSAQTLEVKIFWANIKVSVLCFIPLALMYFTFSQTKRKLPNSKLTFLLFAIAVLNLVIIWNDHNWHIFRTNTELYRFTNSIPIIKSQFGIWFKTVYVWSLYIPTIVTILIYISAFLNSGKVGRLQYGAMATAMTLSLLAGLPQLSSLTHLDSYACSAGVTAIIYFILIHKYYIFGIVPLSSNALIDMLDTGVLIFDNKGKLLEANTAAEKLLDENSDLNEICGKLNINLNNIDENGLAFSSSEISFGEKAYSAKLQMLKGAGNRNDGYVIFITDATQHRKLLQVQKEKELTEQKNTIIGDIHDNISGGISVMSLLASNALDDCERTEENLHKIINIASDTSREVRFMMNAYEREHFRLKDLAGDIRYTAGLLTDESEISFSLQTDIHHSQEEQEITFFKYVNLVRFFKESVINCVKHSGASELNAFMKVSSNEIVITIKDNGCGFSPDNKPGRGLRGMERRAALMNGKAVIDGSAGTKIICTIPLYEQG